MIDPEICWELKEHQLRMQSNTNYFAEAEVQKEERTQIIRNYRVGDRPYIVAVTACPTK